MSAEHGIGQLKKKYLSLNRSEVELDLMRQMKARASLRRVNDVLIDSDLPSIHLELMLTHSLMRFSRLSLSAGSDGSCRNS